MIILFEAILYFVGSLVGIQKPVGGDAWLLIGLVVHS